MPIAALGLMACWSAVAPEFITPKMTLPQVCALFPERPTILNRTNEVVRAILFQRARVEVTFEEGRVVAVRKVP